MKFRIFSDKEIVQNTLVDHLLGEVRLSFIGRGKIDNRRQISENIKSQLRELWEKDDMTYSELKRRELEILLNNTWYTIGWNSFLQKVGIMENRRYKDVYYLYEAEVDSNNKFLESAVDNFVDIHNLKLNGRLFIVNKKPIPQRDAEWSYKVIAKNWLSGFGDGYYSWDEDILKNKYFPCTEEIWYTKKEFKDAFDKFVSRFHAYKIQINSSDYFEKRMAERRKFRSNKLNDYFSVIVGDVVIDLKSDSVSRMDSFVKNNDGEHYLVAVREIVNRGWRLG